jgi:ABC-type glutathione transport system ATPase component
MIEATPDPASSAARVVVQELTVSVKGSDAAVVENVSLEVSAGEVLGLVGESGSGKTTLGLAMIGHVRRGLRITAGRVLFDGADVLGLPAPKLRELRGAAMCYVPQDPSAALNPAMKVGVQLREVLTAHGRSKAETEDRVADVLTEVGLADRSDLLQSYPHQLSGGQQQRVAIAMAFACRPKLIVMDEPTTGLDVTTQRTVLNTVAEMCSAYGVATVYVSHDVVVVGELSHRVAVLYAGEIVETGNTADVFAAPAHPYTQFRRRSARSDWSVWRACRRSPGTDRLAARLRLGVRCGSSSAWRRGPRWSPQDAAIAPLGASSSRSGWQTIARRSRPSRCRCRRSRRRCRPSVSGLPSLTPATAPTRSCTT